MYFVYRGELQVFVHDENTNTDYYLHSLNTGSSVNLVSALLEYESLITIKASTDCILYELDKTDIEYVRNRNEALNIAV